MFGAKIEIQSATLYLIHDKVEDQLKRAETELSELASENEERIAFLTKQIEYFKAELKNFKINVEAQLAEEFQFSLEELYNMYGQYETYITIEFHKFSESAKKFGRDIAGVLDYRKSEREEFDKLISGVNDQRTNGYAKIDCFTYSSLTAGQQVELLETGFKCGDIHQILSCNLDRSAAYRQIGRKEIPNTIKLNLDLDNFDPHLANLWLFNQRLKDGGILIDSEWEQFCGYSLHYHSGSEKDMLIRGKGFDEKGEKKIQVKFHEYMAKYFTKEITYEETLDLNDLLVKRRIERIGAIKNEIKKSTNKKLEVFKEEYPDIFLELGKSIYQFETETLVYHEMIKPIYWDYEGYLHIYLRHCDELLIEGHFENKTKFQYSQKDIRRILIMAIERLRENINDRLKNDQDFRVYGDKTLYFNGNYYSLHILSGGRVAAFHPMENPTE